MAGKYSVQNTIEVLDLGMSLAKAIKSAKADGKLDVADIAHLLPIITKVEPAIKDVDQIPLELEELDKEDSERILELGRKRFPELTDDQEVIKRLNAGLEVGIAISRLVSLI